MDTNKGIIAWFTRNSVAANLLMAFILGGGLYMYHFVVNKQMFPEREVNWIKINVAYPGAAPQEVEEGITIKMEERLKSVQGLDRVITYAARNSSAAYLRINEAYDAQETLNEVKSAIDSIPSFPNGMELPRIERIKPRQEVMYISLYGDLDFKQLKELGRQIHTELQALPAVSVSEFYGGLDYEIGIEISKEKLREYKLSFRDVANAVNNFSANRSAGQIKAENGYISLRVENQAYQGLDFEHLPLLNLPDGTVVRLGDVAEVIDGFTEGIMYSTYNGHNSTTFFIGASKDQSISEVAEEVHEYITRKQTTLPQGVQLYPWVDFTYYLDGRLDMMFDNMIFGAILVFIMLALFLRLRLALWVMMGLPVAFLGTMWFLPLDFVDGTINIMSLFGFILVLGVVVDDAIVIGESVHTEVEAKGQTIDNVIRGAKRVAIPATFGVLTTVAAFFPMVISTGPGSAQAHAIGFVVIFCLLFSLVESKLILPAHLALIKPKSPRKNTRNPIYWLRAFIDKHLKMFIENVYRPRLVQLLHYRYTLIVIFISIFMISLGLFANGVVRFNPTPKIPHDYANIEIEMTADSSEYSTLETLQLIEAMVRNVDQQIADEYGNPMIEGLAMRLSGRVEGTIEIKLVEPRYRAMNTFDLSERWRADMPVLPGLKKLHIKDSIFSPDRDDGDISFRLESTNGQQLELAVRELKAKLNTIKGVNDINDSMQSRTDEVQFDLKPLAYSLGLTLNDVASQVSFGFYGLEAQRILRNGEEIRVMVRYPESERNAISQVQHVLIQTPSGAEVTLSEIADIRIVDGVNMIRRENGKRTVSVWAAVDDQQTESLKVTEHIIEDYLPVLLQRYPLVTSEVAGNIRETMEANQQQLVNFVLSMFLIYALLAIPLRSYSQPLIIMSVIPFGIIGAMFGHILLGMDMSSLSMFGVIAAAGVVVNDSLVMVDFVNKARVEGVALREAVIEAGCKRFRAILLTSITTFVGLIPIITETSLQAQFVIPMAVSLAFGVLFATVVTLLLIPCLYVALEDIRGLFGLAKSSEPTTKGVG